MTYTELDKAKAVIFGYDDCILICENARRNLSEELERLKQYDEHGRLTTEAAKLIAKIEAMQKMKACIEVSAAPFRLHYKMLRNKNTFEAPYGEKKND